MKCQPLGALSAPPPLPVPPPGSPADPRDEFQAGGDPPRPEWRGPRPAPPGPLEQRALELEKEQQDRLLARQVYARMRAERELFRARLSAMLAELQTEIHRIWEEVMVRRRKTHDEIMEAWSKVLFG